MTTDTDVAVTPAETAVASVAAAATGVADLFYLLDRVENCVQEYRAHTVDVCRRGGWTWDQIGAALGVSGQAVRVRYGRRVVPTQPERNTQ